MKDLDTRTMERKSDNMPGLRMQVLILLTYRAKRYNIILER